MSYTDPQADFLREARERLGKVPEAEPEDPEAAFKAFFASKA